MSFVRTLVQVTQTQVLGFWKHLTAAEFYQENPQHNLGTLGILGKLGRNLVLCQYEDFKWNLYKCYWCSAVDYFGFLLIELCDEWKRATAVPE